MTIRRGTQRDSAALGNLFEDAVRTIGSESYDPAQVNAWAAAADDREGFGRRMLQDDVFLAEDEAGPVGFATLGPGGHVGALYVRGDCQRRGVGRALLATVLAVAWERGEEQVHAEASAFARPLFEQAGFVVVGTEMVERGGVRIERHLVERRRSGGR